MKENRWVGEEDQEVKYTLKDIKWYKTNEGFFPFVENLDETKVKLLSTGKVVKLKRFFKEEPYSIHDSEPVITVYKDYQSALKKLTKLDGKVLNCYNAIYDYYFKDKRMDLAKNCWINGTQQTICQIKGITSYMNTRLQTELKRVKDSREF